MKPYVTLTVTGGRYDGHTFQFQDGGAYTLGRAGDCDVQIPSDPTYLAVSRHHCTFLVELPSVRIRDQSMNGTTVNGRLLSKGTECELNDGDVIRVGHLVLWVVLETPDVSVPADEVTSGAENHSCV